ncbi:MAG: hypothetical protein RIC55_35680 [Pirellulaceae bacterium]
MNLKKLQSELDLTLHDALLRKLSTDFVAGTADFILDVCVGDPDGKSERERERRRAGRLQLTGLQYLAVDPPDPNSPYGDQSPVRVDPCDADQEVATRYRIPDGAFSGRFFVSDWNGFIHFAAAAATLEWLEPE